MRMEFFSDEVVIALRHLGIETNRRAVQVRLQRICNSNGNVTFREFRKMCLLSPSQRIRDIFDNNEDAYHLDSYTVPTSGQQSKKHGPGTIFLAGGVSGLVSRTLTAPADRIKVLLQAGGGKSTSIRGVFRDVLKEGPLSFWRGNGTNVLKIMPESACKFFANEFFKELIIVDPDNVRPHERLLAGSLAGVSAQTAIYPMEVVKTRLALAKPGLYTGIFDCLAKILKHEGPATLYNGLKASNLGIIPYAGVDLAM